MKKNQNGEGFFSRLLAKPKQAIKDFFYNLSVKGFQAKQNRRMARGKNAVAKISTYKTSAAIFCGIILSYSLLHMILFYVVMPLDGIPMAWKTYDKASNSYVFLPKGHLFDNFKRYVTDIFSNGDVGKYYLRGIGLWFLGFVIQTPTNFFFPYVCFKKFWGTKVMKVIFYLPAIITSMTVIMFLRGILDFTIPSILAEKVDPEFYYINLLEQAPYNVWIVFGYSIFMGMPGSVIVNLAAMANTPPELLESGQLDGLTLSGELWHIILPMMWPMISMSSLSIFTVFFTGGSSGNAMVFYGGAGAPENIITFPYYMQKIVLTADKYNYGYSAASTVLTASLQIPVVLMTKKLFDKIDPMN